jgi:hypothetical protein
VIIATRKIGHKRHKKTDRNTKGTKVYDELVAEVPALSASEAVL